MKEQAWKMLMRMAAGVLGIAVFAGIAYGAEMDSRSGAISITGRGGQNEAQETMVNGLFPVLNAANDVFFVDLRGSYLTFTTRGMDQNENEFNGGLGYRHFFPELDMIAGANAYYDRRKTVHDTEMEQFGAGVEIMTSWLDLRANYYNPKDGNRSFGTVTEVDIRNSTSVSEGDVYESGGRYKREDTETKTLTTSTSIFVHREEPMEGYDAEVAVAVPWLSRHVDTRLVAGYYHFNSGISDDVSGPKWRVEIRPVPAVMASMEWYDDDAMNHSDYFASLTVTLPFSPGDLIHGRNPFTGAREQFAFKPRSTPDRMLEPVNRDFRIRTKHLHNPVVSTETETTTSTYITDLGEVPSPPPQEEEEQQNGTEG